MDACLIQIAVGKTRCCDPDRILTNAQRARINTELAELEQATNTSFFPVGKTKDIGIQKACTMHIHSIHIFTL
jgi:hypothetical protein